MRVNFEGPSLQRCQNGCIAKSTQQLSGFVLKALTDLGFQVEFHSHARAILLGDFPEAVGELEAALKDIAIPIEDIIGSGGGETKHTQSLRRAFASVGWKKHVFEIKKFIDGKERESISHEIDHVRAFETEKIALEIEWNNKDPFFDRDLENFKRLHAEGAISVGVIVTRGESLQDKMRNLVMRFAMQNKIIRRFDSVWRQSDCASEASNRETCRA